MIGRRLLVLAAGLMAVAHTALGAPVSGEYAGADAGLVITSLATSTMYAATLAVKLKRVDQPGQTTLKFGASMLRHGDFKGGFAEPSYLQIFRDHGVSISQLPYEGRVLVLRVPPGRYRLSEPVVAVAGGLYNVWTRPEVQGVEFDVAPNAAVYIGRLLGVPSMTNMPAWRVAVLDARAEDLDIAKSKGFDVGQPSFKPLEDLVATETAPPFLQ
jgi:hypothetical protein